MKGGSKLFIFAGVALAVVAIALGVMSFLGGGKADAKKDASAAKVTIVEAALNIPAHRILTVQDVKEAQVAATDAPAGGALSVLDVIGKAYRVSLTPGQRLDAAQIEQPGLRNDIADGMRAVAVAVDPQGAMSGLIQDQDYIDVIFHARINLVRWLPTTSVQVTEDGTYGLKPSFIPPDLEQPNQPSTGDPGSKFAIRDDVGEAQNLEPLAKIMVQDIRVLRVVRQGETYLGNGELALATAAIAAAPAAAGGDAVKNGQLILEVTPAQAEMLTFMQDKKQGYQVIVRGKDDHKKVSTTGITYQILATNTDWSMPWPKSITSPKEQNPQGGTKSSPTPASAPAAASPTPTGANPASEATPEATKP